MVLLFKSVVSMKIPKDFKPIIFITIIEISYIYQNLYCLYHQSSQCSISPHFVFHVFVWGFTSHWRILSYGAVIITCTGEGLQNLTYARLSRPLSSEGSLACHTHWNPFIMVISEHSWYLHLLPIIWPWSFHYLFKRLITVAAGIRTPNLPHASRTL